MKTMQIDFAPPTLSRALLRLNTFTVIALAVGVVLCFSAGMAAFHVRMQRQAIQEEIQHTQTKLAKRLSITPVAKKTSISAAQAKAINLAVAQLNLPWQDVLDNIEAATPASIALLALEPDGKHHLLKGVAEARSPETMLAYVEELKRQPFFVSVILVKHELNEHDPNKPLRFQFEAHWLGARS